MPIQDGVKPLKLETTPKGSFLDNIPTEANPTEDGLCVAGLDINGTGNILIDADANNNIQLTDPSIQTRKAVDFLRYSFMLGSG